MTKPTLTIDVMDPRLPAILKGLKSPVEKAEQVIAKLEQQRDALNKRAIVHDNERERIAYAARVHHDKDAINRLSQMTTEAIRFGHELKDIEAALATARAKLREAQEHDARKIERERAVDILEQVERLKAAGRKIDDALVVVITAGAEIHAASDELHRLDCQMPTGARVLSHGERALRTAIGQTIWARCIERLAPGERVSFSRVIEQWSLAIENRFGKKSEVA
jgi:hypothetical protein